MGIGLSYAEVRRLGFSRTWVNEKISEPLLEERRNFLNSVNYFAQQVLS
jgi:hypothetical protein